MADEQEYPECRRLSSVRASSQVIGEFIEWLSEQGIHLAKHSDKWDGLEEHYESREQLLARFFEIDLNKVEDERRQMLAKLSGEATDAA